MSLSVCVCVYLYILVVLEQTLCLSVFVRV